MIKLDIRADKETGYAVAWLEPVAGDKPPMVLATCRMVASKEVGDLFKRFCMEAANAMVRSAMVAKGQSPEDVQTVIVHDPGGTFGKPKQEAAADAANILFESQSKKGTIQ